MCNQSPGTEIQLDSKMTPINSRIKLRFGSQFNRSEKLKSTIQRKLSHEESNHLTNDGSCTLQVA